MSPRGGRDGDCVEFPHVGINRVATRSSSCKADDRPRALSEAPTHRSGFEISGPASDLHGVEREAASGLRTHRSTTRRTPGRLLPRRPESPRAGEHPPPQSGSGPHAMPLTCTA
jgi:hypothetical protein